MESVFAEYLFKRRFLVNQAAESAENPAETRIALADLFNIRVINRANLLQPYMIRIADKLIGTYEIPEAFYRGFPETVRDLPRAALYYDQLLHYYNTYGLGNFEEAGHSVFEEDIERKVFDEEMPVLDYTVLTEEEAFEKIREYAGDLLSGSRRLSDEQYELVLEYIRIYNIFPETCGSKNTVIRLLCDTGDTRFARFLMLSDVPKLADELNYRSSEVKNPKKLNLPNRDRKLLTAVIDKLIAEGKIDTRICYEKKTLWAGLLHHIHYKTADPKGTEFLNAMRGSENRSVLSDFEMILSGSGAVDAAEYLLRHKGPGALLRTLDRLLSRCRSDQEVRAVIEMIDTGSIIQLIQLLIHYSREGAAQRSFTFIKYGLMRKHDETKAEADRRKTLLSARDRDAAASAIRSLLEKKLKNRLGKVYIDPAMKRIAVPLQEGAAQGGFGTMSRGSRIPLPEGKKIRAFTYWEKVNDIDLSVIGLDKDLNHHEFSWRTMAEKQSSGITFSGDQTGGYNGGSEYFDIDREKFRQEYPSIRCLVFCDNIYDDVCSSYRNCVCRAGYMLRDVEDSGEIFEPKTVRSAFAIDCDSRFAYLFGLDLLTGEIVWLNTAYDSSSRIAGRNDMTFLTRYFEMTGIINLYDLFGMMASEITDDPKEADIAVTDEEIEAGENTEIIRSYDTERIIGMMAGK